MFVTRTYAPHGVVLAHLVLQLFPVEVESTVCFVKKAAPRGHPDVVLGQLDDVAPWAVCLGEVALNF